MDFKKSLLNSACSKSSGDLDVSQDETIKIMPRNTGQGHSLFGLKLTCALPVNIP